MKAPTLFSCFAALAASSTSFAADDQSTEILEKMVVTATRSETKLREIGSSITVITADQIESRQVFSVLDLLRDVPGVDVVQTGGPGRSVSLFMRGAANGQTLVLIDGIEANDPSSSANAFDFANLTTDNIERVEILRGPQSTLYGSDAIGGVINFITKKGKGKPSYFLQGEGGSFDTFKVAGGVSGSADRVNYSLTASRLETAGFSAADKRLPGNSERDGYKNTSVSARLGVKATELLDFDWILRYQDSKVELDDCGGPFCDDPNFFGETEELYTRLQGALDLFDGFWSQTLGVAYTGTDRRSVDKFDTVSPFNTFPESVSTFEGNKIKASWQHVLALHETNILTLGAEDEEEWMRTDSISRQSANTSGFYLQDQIRLFDRFFTTAGVRVDDHNRIGSRVTWRVTQAINIDETGTRFKGSYGTGFKAPSLFQLFAPGTTFGPIGNADLKPEKSRGWDVGFEQSFWAERILVGANYFNNTFVDLINFTFVSGFDNVDRASAEGVESFLELSPLQGLTLRGSYTYTRTNDVSTGDRLFRRPSHKGSFNANYQFLERADINLNVLLVGDRDDIEFDPTTFASSRTTLPGYILVNLAAGYQLSKNLKLFGRVDNLFDKKYQEVSGFGTSRIAGYAGVRLSFQ